MFKRQHLFLILTLFYLAGCSAGDSKKVSDKSISTQLPNGNVVKAKNDDNKLIGNYGQYDYKYLFCNDKTCQELYLKVLSKTKEDQIPERLKFKLILTDKNDKALRREIEGIAKISSSNESFNDPTEVDPADYFAADYRFTIPDYDISFRLDIERYKACVVYLYSFKKKGKFINHYIKKYPEYDVLKKIK